MALSIPQLISMCIYKVKQVKIIYSICVFYVIDILQISCLFSNSLKTKYQVNMRFIENKFQDNYTMNSSI